MSQSIRNCTNTTNFGSVNSAGYAHLLAHQTVKHTPMSLKMGLPSSNRRPSSAVTRGPSSQGRSKGTPSTAQADTFYPAAIPPKPPSSAMPVEAPSSAQAARNQQSNFTRKSSWDRILKEGRTPDDGGSLFSNFDPLRTLHFLVGELHSKLEYTALGDSNLQQMVSDIQSALKRVPPDVVSSIRLKNEYDKLPFTNSDAMDKPEKLKNPLCEKTCQTDLTESELSWLGEMYRQMQTLYHNLKQEKEELEVHLKSEREQVGHLRKKVANNDTSRKQTAHAYAEELEKEKKQMEMQIQSYQKQTNELLQSTKDLKNMLHTLTEEKCKASDDIATLRHELNLSRAKNDSYLTLIKLRDKQLSQFRIEILELNQFINKQLAELQHHSNPGILSSQSSLADMLQGIPWQQLANLKDMLKNKIDHQSSITSNVNKTNELNFIDLPSGDSSTTLSETLPKTKDSENWENDHGIAEKRSSIELTQEDIRSKFLDLKRQAFLVTGADPVLLLNN